MGPYFSSMSGARWCIIVLRIAITIELRRASRPVRPRAFVNVNVYEYGPPPSDRRVSFNHVQFSSDLHLPYLSYTSKSSSKVIVWSLSPCHFPSRPFPSPLSTATTLSGRSRTLVPRLLPSPWGLFLSLPQPRSPPRLPESLYCAIQKSWE